MHPTDWLATFLPRLCCPVTQQPLHLATAEEKLRLGLPPEQDTLVSEDGAHHYPIVDGIPHLLAA
jgi:uncharacterized protein YbaR (Trm112 family)